MYILTNNAFEINRELYKMGVPSSLDDGEKTIGVFEVLRHPESGDTALDVGDMSQDIILHPSCDLNTIVSLISDYNDEEKKGLVISVLLLKHYNTNTKAIMQLIHDNALEEDRLTMMNHFDSILIEAEKVPNKNHSVQLNRVPFSSFVLPSLDLKDDQYMSANGWF